MALKSKSPLPRGCGFFCEPGSEPQQIVFSFWFPSKITQKSPQKKTKERNMTSPCAYLRPHGSRVSPPTAAAPLRGPDALDGALQPLPGRGGVPRAVAVDPAGAAWRALDSLRATGQTPKALQRGRERPPVYFWAL